LRDYERAPRRARLSSGVIQANCQVDSSSRWPIPCAATRSGAACLAFALIDSSLRRRFRASEHVHSMRVHYIIADQAAPPGYTPLRPRRRALGYFTTVQASEAGLRPECVSCNFIDMETSRSIARSLPTDAIPHLAARPAHGSGTVAASPPRWPRLNSRVQAGCQRRQRSHLRKAASACYRPATPRPPALAGQPSMHHRVSRARP